MQKCDLCDNPSAVDWMDLDANKELHMCLDCNNKIQSEKLGVELPHLIRHRFFLTDCENVDHMFDYEFMLLPNFKLLRSHECDQTRYKCEVTGKLTDDNDELFEEMMRRLHKMMSVKYIRGKS